MSGPIKPSEVTKLKVKKIIPEEVFEAFNETIAKHWDGKTASFTQTEVADLIMVKFGDKYTRAQMYENKFMDVEDAYRAAGWSVEYDRPGYCETYEATFEFSRRTRG